MHTPTHIFLHLALRKYCKTKKNIILPKSFVYGAFAPDALLFLFVFEYTPYSLWQWKTLSQTFSYIFDTLYFTHPLWIFGYNILHAPMMLLFFTGLIIACKKYLWKFYRIFLFFIAGCALHTFLDIPLHHDDGPRIFYPFSDYIFRSPISYWDPNHFGNIVMIIELILAAIILIYIFLWCIFNKQIWNSK